MVARLGMLLLVALTMSACPGTLGDNFGITAYVQNDTAEPLYVRNNSNEANSLVLVPPGVLGNTRLYAARGTNHVVQREMCPPWACSGAEPRADHR